jgi:antitoxin ChpS
METSLRNIGNSKGAAKPKYSLDELLAKCDESAPIPQELAQWDDAQPIGKEL